MLRLYSVGHSNLRADALLALLRLAGIRAVADVRRLPFSRRFPWFSRDALAASLAREGVTYHWVGEGLGGRREPQLPPERSANAALRDPALRAFADAQAEPAFARDLDRLLAIAAQAPTACLCAERDWRRCHRQILADVLLARGCEVLHLGGAGAPEPHRPDGAARFEGGRVSYPALC
jgi:uncharacterized protein (DUF488 family)